MNLKKLIDSVDLIDVIDRLVKVDGWKESNAIAATQQYRNFLFLKLKYGADYELPPSKDI